MKVEHRKLGKVPEVVSSGAGIQEQWGWNSNLSSMTPQSAFKHYSLLPLVFFFTSTHLFSMLSFFH